MPDNLCIKYVTLRENAKEPTKAYDNLEAGWDLYYALVYPGILSSVHFGAFTQYRLPTGIAVEIPPGWCWVLHSRSGWADRYGISVHTGVIDCTYRGEIVVLLRIPNGVDKILFNVQEELADGVKIAQALLLPVPRVIFQRVSGLSPSSRGECGFGSSGRV